MGDHVSLDTEIVDEDGGRTTFGDLTPDETTVAYSDTYLRAPGGRYLRRGEPLDHFANIARLMRPAVPLSRAPRHRSLSTWDLLRELRWTTCVVCRRAFLRTKAHKTSATRRPPFTVGEDTRHVLPNSIPSIRGPARPGPVHAAGAIPASLGRYCPNRTVST